MEIIIRFLVRKKEKITRVSYRTLIESGGISFKCGNAIKIYVVFTKHLLRYLRALVSLGFISRWHTFTRRNLNRNSCKTKSGSREARKEPWTGAKRICFISGIPAFTFRYYFNVNRINSGSIKGAE